MQPAVLIEGVCVLDLAVPGLPTSKARPRVFFRNGKYVAITPEKTANRSITVAVLARTRLGKGFPDGMHRFAIECWFYGKCSDPALWRQDADNMEKWILDSLSKLVWRDDKQVTDTFSHKRCDSGNPRTEIKVYRLGEIT